MNKFIIAALLLSAATPALAQTIPIITTQEQYDHLAPGSQYVAPDGSVQQTPFVVPYTPNVSENCQQLWYARNKMYADAGYCFTTERSLSAFGPRCYFPYGHLTP